MVGCSVVRCGVVGCSVVWCGVVWWRRYVDGAYLKSYNFSNTFLIIHFSFPSFQLKLFSNIRYLRFHFL